MQNLGLLTFNAWALDGYLKVFWRNAAIWQLWPQVLVLTVLATAFMTLARTFARRWEAA
jgi:ABC-2 type transport system permease protein